MFQIKYMDHFWFLAGKDIDGICHFNLKKQEEDKKAKETKEEKRKWKMWKMENSS